jgi:AcrR family transcriptional regulator
MPFTDRSAPARAAILAAARGLLAERGYEATTIRAVAAAAGVDPAMVMRYYGNKEGLLAAAVDVDLALPDPDGVPTGELGGLLAAHIVRRWEGDLADELVTLLLRSAGTNDTAADHLRTVFGRQVVAYVRKLTGDAADSERRAGLIATQVLGIALCRYVLRLPPVVAMSAEELAAAVGQTLQRYLFDDLAG